MEKLQKAKTAKKRQQIIAESQQTTGPAMLFATVDYPGCCDDKKKTEELSAKCEHEGTPCTESVLLPAARLAMRCGVLARGSLPLSHATAPARLAGGRR